MGLKAFLKGNTKNIGTVEYAVSDRFVNEETGELEKFKIRAINAKLDSQLRANCTISKDGVEKFDSNRYLALLVTTCVTYPDFKNAELQDSYGVKDETELVKQMLTSGEFAKLMNKVQEVNGFKETYQDKVEEAKN